MPDTVDADCGGTLELTHSASTLDHSVEEHIDPFYAIVYEIRTE
jgi:hypothetical protein